MREKASYRDNFERLNELFPEQELLNAAQIMRVFGCSLPTARKLTRSIRIPGTTFVSKASLARFMAG